MKKKIEISCKDHPTTVDYDDVKHYCVEYNGVLEIEKNGDEDFRVWFAPGYWNKMTVRPSFDDEEEVNESD